VRSSSASRIVIVGDAPIWLARSRATRATVPLPSLPVALAFLLLRFAAGT
jgi:hypothetical protein